MKVECLGSCGTAPVVQINKDYHEDLSPENFDDLLESLS
jgi:NADH-quinone oxidoreductase subunit E